MCYNRVHLEWKDKAQALNEMWRVTDRYIITKLFLLTFGTAILIVCII